MGNPQERSDEKDWQRDVEDLIPPALMTNHPLSVGRYLLDEAVTRDRRYRVREHSGDIKVSMRQQVEETIEVIRPALQADGGDIVLHEVNEETGVISVELVGACTTCPASDQTMKAGIERIMKDRIDGVTAVVQVA